MLTKRLRTNGLARVLTDAVDGFFTGKRYLIHDRDPLYTRGLYRHHYRFWCLRAQAAAALTEFERFVRSIKEGCLDRMMFFGEDMLRDTVREFVTHYHREHNHQGLDNQLLTKPPAIVSTSGSVRKLERVGGLLNYYYREAHDS